MLTFSILESSPSPRYDSKPLNNYIYLYRYYLWYPGVTPRRRGVDLYSPWCCVAVCNWVQLVCLWLHDHHRIQGNCGFILLQSENHNTKLRGSWNHLLQGYYGFITIENHHNITGELDTTFSRATVTSFLFNVTGQLDTTFSRATVV
jgi:hypothetical protein